MPEKEIVVAVSGGFDPLHIGHLYLFEEAKSLGHKLVVIINNDNWVIDKKGYRFMPENERMEIIKSIRYVDDVVLTEHARHTIDGSVCKELEKLRPDIFANGGDRKRYNIPEYYLCQSLGIRMVFNVGGDKVRSSSNLVKEAALEYLV